MDPEVTLGNIFDFWFDAEYNLLLFLAELIKVHFPTVDLVPWAYTISQAIAPHAVILWMVCVILLPCIVAKADSYRFIGALLFLFNGLNNLVKMYSFEFSSTPPVRYYVNPTDPLPKLLIHLCIGLLLYVFMVINFDERQPFRYCAMCCFALERVFANIEHLMVPHFGFSLIVQTFFGVIFSICLTLLLYFFCYNFSESARVHDKVKKFAFKVFFIVMVFQLGGGESIPSAYYILFVALFVCTVLYQDVYIRIRYLSTPKFNEAGGVHRMGCSIGDPGLFAPYEKAI